MTPEEIDELRVVSHARKQQMEARLAGALRQELQMRAMIDEMADQFRAGLSYRPESLTSMHGLGAHQAWVDSTRRRRATMNIDLAQVIAERMECQDRLRRLMGQHDALDSLHAEAMDVRKRAQATRRQEKMLDAYLLRDLSV